MFLPSKKIVLGRLALIVSAATVALTGAWAVSSFHREMGQITKPSPVAATWDDVNLATGEGPSPEDELTMARSKIFEGLEAR